MAHPCRKEREHKKATRADWENIAKETLSKVKKVKNKKKKTYNYFLENVPSLITYKDHWIRDPKDWVTKSHNEKRQLNSFVSWLFCKYSPPEFLFSLFAPTNKKYAPVRYTSFEDQFISWFIDIGQGKSFQKMTSTIFTKKEAHLFFTHPKAKGMDAVGLILYHIMWVKCKARNLPESICSLLAYRLSDTPLYTMPYNKEHRVYRNFYSKHFLDFLALYSKDPLLDVETVGFILDYFTHLPLVELDTFSFKGRTLNSVIQLANQWHYQQTQKKSVVHTAWHGLNIQDFVYNNKFNIEYKIKQLKSSTALLNEGRKMHHCVGSYSSRCSEGLCGIFTMSNSLNEKIATIEVDSQKVIVQIQGPCNKKVNDENRKIIEKWAREQGLSFKQWR